MRVHVGLLLIKCLLLPVGAQTTTLLSHDSAPHPNHCSGHLSTARNEEWSQYRSDTLSSSPTIEFYGPGSWRAFEALRHNIDLANPCMTSCDPVGGKSSSFAALSFCVALLRRNFGTCAARHHHDHRVTHSVMFVWCYMIAQVHDTRYLCLRWMPGSLSHSVEDRSRWTAPAEVGLSP